MVEGFVIVNGSTVGKRRAVRRRRGNCIFAALSTRGRRSVRVGYCVLLIVVAMECGVGIARAYRDVKEDVLINYGS